MLYIQFFRKDLSRPIIYYFRVRDFTSYAKALANIRADGLQAVNVYEFDEFKRFPETYGEWKSDLSFNHASMRSAPKSLFPYINEVVKPMLAAGIQDSWTMTGDGIPSIQAIPDPPSPPKPRPVQATLAFDIPDPPPPPEPRPVPTAPFPPPEPCPVHAAPVSLAYPPLPRVCL